MSRNEYVALACTMPKSWIEAKDRDSSSADQAARINATHSELFDVLVKREKQFAELIAADREYDAARRAWDDGCFTRWDGIDNSARTKIADRFESATARRASALAALGQQS